MNTKIKCGVIGCGSMGQNHVRVYTELEQAVMVGLMEPDAKIATDVARKFNCRAFGSIEDMKSAGIQCVSVAVPTVAHHSTVIAALEAGMDVLVEKPIAGTVTEGQEMIATARRLGRKLMVGHVERFNPVVEYLRGAVRADEVVSVNIVRVGPIPPRIKDVGVVIDLAVHDIDLARVLTQREVKSVYSVISANISEREDFAALLLDLGAGVSAQITTNWITPFKSRALQVVTKDKIIEGNLITRIVREFTRYTVEDSSFVTREVVLNPEEPLKKEVSAFLRAVAEDAPVPVAGEDGLEALRVAIEALRR